MNPRVRVLVVDDSAFARKALRTVLEACRQIEVVGIARDGLEGLEKIAALKPDVVTLDLIMPNLDGLGLLRALPAEGAPRVVVVSITDAHSELAIAALQLGAVDLVQKPTALATDRLYEINDELVRKVLDAARAKPSPLPALTGVPPTTPPLFARKASLVVIGASTGGPNAITRLLSALPADFPVPIAVALHIPAGYTDALAVRLNEQCQLEVAEADEGMLLRPGLAVLAPGGQHLLVHRRGTELRAQLSSSPRESLYYPSVNVLFESAAQAASSGVLAVVLTGMGDDGCLGAGAVRRAGGVVLTEHESSCVIYGMPRSVVEAGHSSAVAALDQLPRLILDHL
jgi:two-component system, chemotaxis family, protein-glutamate methylesterase/glutaminase